MYQLAIVPYLSRCPASVTVCCSVTHATPQVYQSAIVTPLSHAAPQVYQLAISRSYNAAQQLYHHAIPSLSRCPPGVGTSLLQSRPSHPPSQVYQFTEVVLVLQRPHGGQFPGLYLFTTPGRMMRPVINLYTKSVEFIGTFEQVYLNIAISTDQIDNEVRLQLACHRLLTC